MNRAEVLEQMAPIMDLQVRDIEHNPRTRVMVNPEVVTFRPGGGARLLEVTPDGVRGMAREVGFPKDLGSKISPDSFGRVATELLAHKGRYSLLIRDGRIADFAKSRQHRNLNPERMLQTVERTIHNVDFHRVIFLDRQSVSLEVVGEEQRAVVKGDLVRAGALISFSPIGIINPMVQSYVMRLTCTNGLTSNDVLREFRFGGGEGDDVWQWFRQSIRAAYNALESITNRYREMRNERIRPEDRAVVLEAMLKEAGITREAAEAVRNLALREPPQNTYDIINLVTWASSHLLESPRQVTRARQAAADFVDRTEHRRICPVCHRAR